MNWTRTGIGNYDDYLLWVGSRKLIHILSKKSSSSFEGCYNEWQSTGGEYGTFHNYLRIMIFEANSIYDEIAYDSWLETQMEIDEEQNDCDSDYEDELNWFLYGSDWDNNDSPSSSRRNRHSDYDYEDYYQDEVDDEYPDYDDYRRRDG